MCVTLPQSSKENSISLNRLVVVNPTKLDTETGLATHPIGKKFTLCPKGIARNLKKDYFSKLSSMINACQTQSAWVLAQTISTYTTNIVSVSSQVFYLMWIKINLDFSLSHSTVKEIQLLCCGGASLDCLINILDKNNN